MLVQVREWFSTVAPLRGREDFAVLVWIWFIPVHESRLLNFQESGKPIVTQPLL